MNKNQPKDTKHIDTTKPSFVANGKEYFITTTMSAGRYCEYQILEKEVGFSTDFKNVFNIINEACELFDNARSFGEMASARNKLDDLRRGVAKLESKQPTILLLCSLFINTADEDPSTWDRDLAEKKIHDWITEGIDIKDFFSLALNSVNGFIDIFNQMSKRITDIGK